MTFKPILTRFFAAVIAAGAIGAAIGLPLAASAVGDDAGDAALVERGRYLVRIAGCNDCHTPNYPESGGNVPEALWLTGTSVGWQGPWGTTYPANLRTFMHEIDADAWVKLAHTAKFRPPMPWFMLRDMSETDLRAIHALARHLGPAGAPAPEYVPPGVPAKTPVIVFPGAEQAVAAKK
jgi:mono/diheme cytochrome c family protein